MNIAVTVSRHTNERLNDISAALFRPMGVDGVYARSAIYERVIAALGHLISSERDPRAEIFSFPPVMSRRQLEKSGYLSSFPNLLGCVCCLQGSEAQILGTVNRIEDGEDWTQALSASDLIMSPAACYPVYPIAASRGSVPGDGLLFDVSADCFRHEPSTSLDRLQSFRMREFVKIGSPQQIQEFRQGWMTRAKSIAERLGLDATLDKASDPFFGRGGQWLAVSQIQQCLKFELLIPTHSVDRPTACMSFNYHQDHFGLIWDLKTADGQLAHTACVAFGIDRLALALFCAHGIQLEEWPPQVRALLQL